MYDLQKAGFGKRLSAFLFDFIILAVVTVGFAWLISSVTGFYGTVDRFSAELENSGIDLNMTEEQYNALTEAQREEYRVKMEALNDNEQLVNDYFRINSLILVMVTLSPFFAFLVLEFAIPIFLGNGQTLGKKIFAVGVMRMDGVKLTAPVLFARNILGKLTIETLVPLYMVLMIFMRVMLGMQLLDPLLAIVIGAAIVLINLVMTLTGGQRRSLHDFFASTVAVDMHTQMIFDTKEEMLEYKKRLHRELVDKSEY